MRNGDNIITIFQYNGEFLSQNHDPSNPHSSVPKETWLNGPNGHGYAVNNNQQPSALPL